MRKLLTSLIISFAVFAIASPSFAGDDREDRKSKKDKIEQSHHSKKDKNQGNPFDKIMEQLDELNYKLDELLAKDVDLRGVTQNWDKKLLANDGDPCDSSRFTCVLDGQAVRDNETGLVWEQSPSIGARTWEEALAHCANREVGGRKGWQLPMREQLASLMDPSTTSPPLSVGHPFDPSRIRVGTYWTATTYEPNPMVAYTVHTFQGTVGTRDKDVVHGGEVWCVRGGQSFDGQNLDSLN